MAKKLDMLTPAEEFEQRLEKLFAQYLPGAMVRKTANFDDVYYGYDLIPEPGYTLRVGISLNDAEYVRIMFARTDLVHSNITTRVIYKGFLPYGGDRDGMAWLGITLKHYQNQI